MCWPAPGAVALQSAASRAIVASLAAARSAIDIGSCSTAARPQQRRRCRGSRPRRGRTARTPARSRHSPRLAVAGDRHVDEARVLGGERVVVEAPRRHHAGPEVLDEHVDGAGEAPHEVAPGRLRQVDGDQPLAEVELHEPGRARDLAVATGAGLVAAGRLELDDVGAELGEHPRAVRPGDDPGEVEDPDAGQRSVGAHRHVRPRGRGRGTAGPARCRARAGRPSTFSPRWLRWIWSVPPAIEVAGLLSAKSWNAADGASSPTSIPAAPWTCRPSSRWPPRDVGHRDLGDRALEPGDAARAHPQVRVAHDRPTGVQDGEVLAHVGIVAAVEVGDELR